MLRFETNRGSDDVAVSASDQLMRSIRADLQELSKMFACLSPADEDLDGNDLYEIVRARAAIDRGIALTERPSDAPERRGDQSV